VADLGTSSGRRGAELGEFAQYRGKSGVSGSGLVQSLYDNK
jgi:hypothetical protein